MARPCLKYPKLNDNDSIWMQLTHIVAMYFGAVFYLICSSFKTAGVYRFFYRFYVA